MTTKDLAFRAPPNLAIAANATTPNPGIAGVSVWSTVTNSLLVWNGNLWEENTGGGAPTQDSIFAPVRFDHPWGWWWNSDGNGGGGVSAGAIVFTTGTGAPYVMDGTHTILNTLPHTPYTSGTAQWSAGGCWSPNHKMKVGTSLFGGIVFECLGGFTPSTNGQMFMGIQTGTLLFSDSPPNSVAAIGIGGFGSDNLNTGFRIYFGNGTTFNSSTWINRPAGTRNDPIYKVYIRILPGATEARIWVIDYGIAGSPEGISVLTNYAINISTLPVTTMLEGTMGYGNGSSTVSRVFRAAYMRQRSFVTQEVFQEAAVNITGNAASADTLVSLAGLPQGGATNNQVLTWNGGAWAPAAAGGGGSSDPLILTSTDASGTVAGTVKLFRRSVSGRQMPGFVGPSGLDTAIQPFFARNKIGIITPTGNATTLTALGITAPTATGTATTVNVATTNLYTRMRGLEYLVTTAAATAVAGFRIPAAQFTVGGNAADRGGFHLVIRFGPATGVATTTNRCFVGMANSTAAPTDVEPSTITNIVGCGWDAADAFIQIMHRGTGGITKIPTTLAIPLVDRTSVYELALFSPPGTTQTVMYELNNFTTGESSSGTISTNLPTTTTLLAPRGWMSVGGTSSVIGINLFGLYIETDY